MKSELRGTQQWAGDKLSESDLARRIDERIKRQRANKAAETRWRIAATLIVVVLVAMVAVASSLTGPGE